MPKPHSEKVSVESHILKGSIIPFVSQGKLQHWQKSVSLVKFFILCKGLSAEACFFAYFIFPGKSKKGRFLIIEESKMSLKYLFGLYSSFVSAEKYFWFFGNKGKAFFLSFYFILYNKI